MTLSAKVASTIRLFTNSADRSFAFRFPMCTLFQTIRLPWCQFNAELDALFDSTFFISATSIEGNTNEACRPRWFRVTISYTAKFTSFVVLEIGNEIYDKC